MLDYRSHALNHYKSYVHHHPEIHDDLLSWLSKIPLSRPIWDIGVDFADGVLTGDIVHHFYPDLIDLDSIHRPKNMSQRTANWHYLSTLVLPKIGLYIPHMIIVDITNGVHRAAELFLLQLRKAIQEYSIRIRNNFYLANQGNRSFGLENNDWAQGQATTRQMTNLPAITNSFSSNPNNGQNQSHSQNHHNAKNQNKNGPTTTSFYGKSGLNSDGNGGGNQNGDSLAPCREMLKVKDQEIDQLKEQIKTFEKLIREKTKLYEKLIRTRDDRIQELETRIEKMKVKRT